MKEYLLGAVVLGLSMGCASEPTKPAVAPAGTVEEPAPAGDAPAAEQEFPNKDPKQAQVHISDRIREACGLSDTDTYFAYNRTDVSGRARQVLKKLADCFTTGPLAGQQMALVGHADPRGDEEYNMVLGERRADSVKVALVGLNMADGQIATTSRGEMDATGTDEASWAKDRKVDVTLEE